MFVDCTSFQHSRYLLTPIQSQKSGGQKVGDALSADDGGDDVSSSLVQSIFSFLLTLPCRRTRSWTKPRTPWASEIATPIRLFHSYLAKTQISEVIL